MKDELEQKLDKLISIYPEYLTAGNPFYNKKGIAKELTDRIIVNDSTIFLIESKNKPFKQQYLKKSARQLSGAYKSICRGTQLYTDSSMLEKSKINDYLYIEAEHTKGRQYHLIAVIAGDYISIKGSEWNGDSVPGYVISDLDDYMSIEKYNILYMDCEQHFYKDYFIHYLTERALTEVLELFDTTADLNDYFIGREKIIRSLTISKDYCIAGEHSIIQHYFFCEGLRKQGAKLIDSDMNVSLDTTASNKLIFSTRNLIYFK